MFRIAHLVDDTTPGGITRYLDFILQDPGMAEIARHQVVVVSRHNPARHAIDADMIVSHLAISWRGLPGLMALRARHANVPLVHIEHSYCERFAAAHVSARRRFHHLLRTAYALFDRVLAVSEAQERWLSHRVFVGAAALGCIPPCVDLAPLSLTPPPGDAVRTIGAIGRFDTQKGFDILIRAFRQVEDSSLRLALFGQGSGEDMLRDLAAGDSRIRFPGFATTPAAAYERCDVIAMPSRWEPYGLVALEANAAGRPVLLSGADGLREQQARGNILVPENTPAAWAASIRAIAAQPLAPPPADVAITHVQRTRLAWRALVRRCGGPGTAPARALSA